MKQQVSEDFSETNYLQLDAERADEDPMDDMYADADEDMDEDEDLDDEVT